MITKKDIARIIKEGTREEKLVLLSEDIARHKSNKERILSDIEVDSMVDKFTTQAEIQHYNKFRYIDDAITVAIATLTGLRFELETHFSNLRGYILVWNAIENAELLANSILNEIKDVKERKRIASKAAKRVNLLFTKTTPDQEGYIETNIGTKNAPIKNENYTLWYVIGNVERDFSKNMVKFLSWKKAILDYMQETGFKIPTYEAIIENINEEVNSFAIWNKYTTSVETFSKNQPPERIDKLKIQFDVTTKTDDLKVNMTIYKNFKAKHFVNYEEEQS